MSSMRTILLLTAACLPFLLSCSRGGEDHLKLGAEKYDSGDYDGAVAEYSKVIEADPRNAVAYNKRGVARRDWGLAIADWTKAIELDPKYAWPHYNLGMAEQRKGDYDGAITEYTKAITLDADTPDFYAARGGAKTGAGDYDGAITDYTRVIEKQPNNPRPLFNRGVANWRGHYYRNAASDLHKAKELNDKDYDSWRSYVHTGYPSKESLAIFDRVNELRGDIAANLMLLAADQASDSPESSAADYRHRGDNRFDEKDYDGAISNYTAAIKVDPNDALSYNGRGVAKERKKYYSGAKRDLDRALDLNPRYARAYGNRADCKDQMGDFAGAVGDYSKAIELAPDVADLYKGRADAHQQMGDTRAASADYSTAHTIDAVKYPASVSAPDPPDVMRCKPTIVEARIVLAFDRRDKYALKTIVSDPSVSTGTGGVSVRIIDLKAEPTKVGPDASGRSVNGIAISCRIEILAASDEPANSYKVNVQLPRASDFVERYGEDVPVVTFSGRLLPARDGQVILTSSLPPAPTAAAPPGWIRSSWRASRGLTKFQSLLSFAGLLLVWLIAMWLGFMPWTRTAAAFNVHGAIVLGGIFALFVWVMCSIVLLFVIIRLIFIWP